MKAKIVGDGEGRYVGIRINCPGCGDRHVLPTDFIPPGMTRSPHYVGHAHWHFNGDFEKPRLTPSVNVRTGHYVEGKKDEDNCWCTYYAARPEETQHFKCYVCHFFLRDGIVEFLGDCTHHLKGQTVELPDINPTPVPVEK